MKNPRVILITGASSGIGAALARLYATAGITLLLTGRDAGRMEAVAAACRKKGAAVDTAALDICDRAAMQEQLQAWDDQAPIDLIIANAGISGGSGGAGTGFSDILTTNLGGTLHSVQPLLDRMVQRRRGQIALMSSMAGWRGMPNAPAYSVSKMAVRAYGEAMRPLLRRDNVQMNVIFPGFVKTPLTDANKFTMPFIMSAEKAAWIIRRGLQTDRARIVFPRRMYFLSRLVAALPLYLGDFILSNAPTKD